MTLSPTKLTFANQNLKTASPSQPITLKNTGTGTLTITGFTTTTDFGETKNCGSTLAAGSSCTISVATGPGKFQTAEVRHPRARREAPAARS